MPEPIPERPIPELIPEPIPDPLPVLLHNPPPPSDSPETRFLKWVFIGPDRLRVGWMVAIFLFLFFLIFAAVGSSATYVAKHYLHLKLNQFSAESSCISEGFQFLALVLAAWLCSLIEGRRFLTAYYISGPRRPLHFASGLIVGFATLSALVGALHWGGWLSIGPPTLAPAEIFRYAAIWGISFLLVGLTEEGLVRCYLQFTLARGINFWWALGVVALLCASCLLFVKNEGAIGVYIMAALGLLPCALLHLKKSSGQGFWHAAWLTSTFFGFIHTGNAGETWIGIFGAAAIGFTLCVSIRLTGSVWWAVGYHAAWDWAQTFFYGTADSGFQPQGHYLTANPIGKAFWSGGTDGPEGSILVLPTILLTLVLLIAIYNRKRQLPDPAPIQPFDPLPQDQLAQ